MTTNTTIKSILANINSLATKLHDFEVKSFDSKATAQREIGQQFKLLVAAEGDKATPNGTFTKYEKQLPLGRTVLVNECYELAMLSDADYKRLVTAYKKVGIKGELNTDKSPKLHTEKLGRAAKALRDKRYNLSTGELKAMAQGGGKATKASKIDAQRTKVVEFVASVGVEDNADWDFRYVPTDELKAMRDAINAELKARELGAKVMH